MGLAWASGGRFFVVGQPPHAAHRQALCVFFFIWHVYNGHIMEYQQLCRNVILRYRGKSELPAETSGDEVSKLPSKTLGEEVLYLLRKLDLDTAVMNELSREFHDNHDPCLIGQADALALRVSRTRAANVTAVIDLNKSVLPPATLACVRQRVLYMYVDTKLLEGDPNMNGREKAKQVAEFPTGKALTVRMKLDTDDDSVMALLAVLTPKGKSLTLILEEVTGSTKTIVVHMLACRGVRLHLSEPKLLNSIFPTDPLPQWSLDALTSLVYPIQWDELDDDRTRLLLLNGVFNNDTQILSHLLEDRNVPVGSYDQLDHEFWNPVALAVAIMGVNEGALKKLAIRRDNPWHLWKHVRDSPDGVRVLLGELGLMDSSVLSQFNAVATDEAKSAYLHYIEAFNS